MRGVGIRISDPNVAAGEKLSQAAFRVPAETLQGNLGRNTLRRFGATDLDVTVRRQFRLHERLSVRTRAGLFNLFNYPNFARQASPLYHMSVPRPTPTGPQTRVRSTSVTPRPEAGR